jgi:hypothetical protein
MGATSATVAVFARGAALAADATVVAVVAIDDGWRPVGGSGLESNACCNASASVGGCMDVDDGIAGGGGLGSSACCMVAAGATAGSGILLARSAAAVDNQAVAVEAKTMNGGLCAIGSSEC